jgi:hypothetical protein
VNRSQLRLVAGVSQLAGLLAVYWIQPDQLALFENPKLVAAVVGMILIVSKFLDNWLPSMTGNTAGEKPPAT